MFARDRYPAYISATNAIVCPFQLKLNTSSVPTVVYGSNWIASVSHSSATNSYTVTMKDNIVAIIDAEVNLRDPGGASAGQYVTFGQVSNEASTSACTFVLATFTNSGAALSDNSGVVGGFIVVNNTNVITPGGN